MRCPIDENELAITERQGIEIDYCPKCRGVWLDRGELDKLIERAAVAFGPSSGSRPREEDRGRYEQERDSSHGHKKRKKSSLFAELFDF